MARRRRKRKRKPSPATFRVRRVTGMERLTDTTYRLSLSCGHSIVCGDPVDGTRLGVPKKRRCFKCNPKRNP